MIWPYVCLVLALIAASLTLAGVAPVNRFAVITIAFAALFVSATARVFHPFGLSWITLRYQGLGRSARLNQ